MLLLSCKSGKEITNNVIESPINIIIPEKISFNEILNVEIQNTTNDTLILINPVIKTIEKMIDGNWVLQKIRYCPCGADCQQAIPRMELFNTKNFSIEWNLKESWCVKNENGILEKKISKVTPGIYRVVIKYEKEKYQTQIIYKEFEITD